MASSDPQLVTFRCGCVADWTVVQVLLELEAQGARFKLVDPDRFRVIPSSVLTPDVTAFLRAHRNECRRVLEHDADAHEALQ